MLELMEAKELIVRQVDPDDRRARLVLLTEKGRDTARQLYDVCSGIRDTLDSAVSQSEMKHLLNGLRRVSDAMDEIEVAITTKREEVTSR